MMAGPSLMMMLMTLLTQGNASDLLDYVQSQAYWELNGVQVTVSSMQAQLAPVDAAEAAKLADDLTGEDAAKQQAARSKIALLGSRALPALYKAAEAAQGKPDKAAAIQAAIGEVLQKPKTGAVRRLMAIRTLGELKKPEAVETLQGLLKSKTMFEAEYAKAAIAAIQGKPFQRAPAPAKALAGDPWKLPSDCGVVGQLAIPQGGGFDFDEALKAMGPMLGGQEPQQALRMVTGMLLEATGRVGNVRIQSVTFGVASNVGPHDGFVAVLVRGQYDAKAVKQVIAQEGGGETEKIGGLEVLRPDEEVALILPSDEMLVFVAGPRRRRVEGGEPQPGRPTDPAVKAVIAAITKETPSLSPTGDVGKLIKAVDTTAPMWAVAKVSDAYRQGGPIIQPFDTASLVGKPTKDGKAIDLTLTARGTDAEGITTAVAEFNKGLQEAKNEVSNEAQQMPFLQTISDFLASIETTRDGQTVTVKGQLKGSAPMMMLPMMFGMRAAPMPAEIRVEEGPARGDGGF